MIRKGSTIIAGVATNTKSNSNTLLSFKWSDHIINSMEWLRADTFSWQSGSVYVSAYNHLTADISTATQSTETIAGTTITVYTATDGHKIVLADQEANVSAIYSATGVAWYYIVDTANTRFKLPRTTSLSDAVKGNGKTIGITNGTNDYSLAKNGSTSDQDLCCRTFGTGYLPRTDSTATPTVSVNSIIGLTTDPSKSGIVVERTTDSQHKYLYFYVGEYSQSATEQTAGITTEQLNAKADTDLSNMNAGSTARETIIGWGNPDNDSAVSITTTVGQSFTCPKDGYLYMSVYAYTSANGMLIYSSSKATYRGNVYCCSVVKDNSAVQSVLYPVQKGEVLTCTVSSSYSKQAVFIPVKGE